MNLGQLEALGLSKRWPKLRQHLEEVASFERHRLQAESKVGTLRAQLPAAHEKDLDAEAQAVRAGKGIPLPEAEPKLQAELDVATRESVVMARAAESARADLDRFMQQHQQQLFEDVAEARSQIASKAATAASEALAAYGKYEDLKYLVRSLQPPPAQPDHNAPAARLTQSIVGVATTRGGGPSRGDVEAMLSYLISLGASPEEGENAA